MPSNLLERNFTIKIAFVKYISAVHHTKGSLKCMNIIESLFSMGKDQGYIIL